jgi:transcriptional regulator of arginine metabolism
MTKPARHFAIKEIIAAGPITSQEELRRHLRKRGCRVTQATLSRDLKDLGVARIAGAHGGHYSLQPAGEVRALRPLVGAEVVGMQSNESMIVILTLPGAASTVGEFIDILRHPDIIGTVAGDNTVLVIPKSQKRTQTIEQYLKHKLIEGLEQ